MEILVMSKKDASIKKIGTVYYVMNGDETVFRCNILKTATKQFEKLCFNLGYNIITQREINEHINYYEDVLDKLLRVREDNNQKIRDARKKLEEWKNKDTSELTLFPEKL